ncbi:MAG: hypothetical protein ACPGFC_07595, partial [Paracoccaceae bacterium]
MSASPPGRHRPKDHSYIADPVVATCGALVFGGAIAFGVWATMAPLAQGVTAGGVLIVEDRRRTVQHLEGGIIQDIRIHEGGKIKGGDLAMIISDAGSEARFSQARAEMLRLTAELDRVDAQIAGHEVLQFLRLSALDTTAQEIAGLTALNEGLFADQHAALTGEKDLVRARIDRLLAQSAAIDVKRSGKSREIATLQDEHRIQTTALTQQMGNISRVNELSRLLAITETEFATLDEEERVIEQSIREARLELAQIDLGYRAKLAAERSDLS